MAPDAGEEKSQKLTATRGKANTRAKNKKSRLGCGECKAKRLKCDETHPSCKQCTRRGRQCPGYQKQYRWSTVHEKTRPVEQDPDVWPRAEHTALLGALPRSKCCHGQCQHEHADAPARAEPGGVDASPLSMSAIFATPETDGESGGQAQEIQSNAFQSATTDDAADQTTWPMESSIDWLADPVIAFTDETSIPDLLPDFCSPSLWQTDGQAVYQQNELQNNTVKLTPPKPPKLLYTPVDLSTMLMEYWFSDVCPMWSAFDSPSNPHRQLAANVWQHSEAVFYALQSMSAACLVDSLPHLKKHVGTLSSQAVEAIQCGVRAHKQLNAETSVKFPKELLLSIIAMGTSVCWTDTRQLGLWFLTKAHELLAQYDTESPRLDESGQQELVYFREALVYWEMLYRIVGSDPRNHLRKRKRVYMKTLQLALSSNDGSSASAGAAPQQSHPATPLPQPNKGICIHPWTGISTDIQHTFGLVILLCREHRLSARKQEKRTTANLTAALCDIKLAGDLARELAETDLYSGDHSENSNIMSNSTGDSITPVRHLVDTAEAYRLAALLLLCQTFPDLETENLPGDPFDSVGVDQHGRPGRPDQKHNSLALAMRLVETLRRVPAESGTRCIQPILYVVTGSGLKFDAVEGESEIPEAESDMSNPMVSRQAGSITQSGRLDIALLGRGNGLAAESLKTASLTQCTLEVSRGRRFVVDRLCALQRSLPPRPIGVALDLVKAIWTEYDYNRNPEPPHWIDIMVDKGLQTLFG